MADLPIVGILAFAFQETPLDNAVLGYVKRDFLVANSFAPTFDLARPLGRITTEHAVQPLDMHRVENVFDSL
jgi:hypothetical protein